MAAPRRWGTIRIDVSSTCLLYTSPSPRDRQTVWQEGNSVAIRYKETHRLGQRESSRASVAIIGIYHHNAQWTYLHETPLSQES